MRTLTFKRRTALSISLALILALVATMSIAEQKTKIAGKVTLSYTGNRLEIDVGDTEGHSFSVSESEGTNLSTGKHEFMDGAQVINISFGDLAKGNGLQQGYIKFGKSDDTAFAKWEGKVTTTLSLEGTPVTVFEGSLHFIKGTGQFANIQGRGSYKGGFISKTIYTAEWEGEYFIKK